jgi:hypothetical protein
MVMPTPALALESANDVFIPGMKVRNGSIAAFDFCAGGLSPHCASDPRVASVLGASMVLRAIEWDAQQRRQAGDVRKAEPPAQQRQGGEQR